MNSQIPNSPDIFTTPQPPTKRVAEYAETAKAKACETGDKVKQTVGEAADKAKETVKQVGQNIAATSSEALEKGKEQGKRMLDEQKVRVASEIHTYSEAARRAADELNAESNSNLSHYVSIAADRLDQLGKHIEERNIEELGQDASRMARKHPEIFFGGMFVAGLAAARFLRASKRQRSIEENGNGQLIPTGATSYAAMPPTPWAASTAPGSYISNPSTGALAVPNLPNMPAPAGHTSPSPNTAFNPVTNPGGSLND